MKTLTLLIALLMPVEVLAVCHLYVMPSAGTGVFLDPRKPKYPIPARTSALYYANQDLFLVAANVPDDVDKKLEALPDVVKLPDDLDQAVGAALGTVQSRLQSRNIPAGWINAGTSYRTVVRTVINVFYFVQRFVWVTRIKVALIDGTNISLSTQFNQLNATNQKRLLDAANNLKLDTSGFTGASTMTQILKGVADQLGIAKNFTLGCATI